MTASPPLRYAPDIRLRAAIIGVGLTALVPLGLLITAAVVTR